MVLPGRYGGKGKERENIGIPCLLRDKELELVNGVVVWRGVAKLLAVSLLNEHGED